MKSQRITSRLIALCLLVVLMFGGMLVACSSTDDGKDNQKNSTNENKIAIIHTNDIHGYDAASGPTEKEPGVIGLAAVSQLKKDYEEQGYQVLLFDDGDAVQGNNLVNLSKGATAIEFMNAAGFNAMSLGNHEFDWGADNLQQLITEADFPVLAANVFVDATGELYTQANVTFILENGTKVGVFGLDTPETATKTNPKNVAGLTFLAGEELYACAQKQVDELKEQGCDLIICLGHLGSVGGVAPDRSIDVLEKTQGIDLFIDGHDHEVVNETINNSLLVSTGCHLENIGVVIYEDGVFSEQMVTYGSYNSLDSAVNELITTRNNEVNDQLSQIIATSAVELNGEREPGVRTEETNLGDLAADAALWQAQQAAETKVDGAIVNGGSIRASISQGDISMNTLKKVFPYQNSLDVVTVTGAQLLETLEAAAFSLPTATGSFPQVAGINYTIDSSIAYEQGQQYPNSTYYAPALPGARVTITDVGGRGFSLDENYVIAASSFITAGGDTYYVMAQAYNNNGYITGINDSEMLTNYINTELGGAIDSRYATPQGRIIIK